MRENLPVLLNIFWMLGMLNSLAEYSEIRYDFPKATLFWN